MAELQNKLKELPEVELLEEKSHFIRDEVLRENLAIKFQHLLFLISLDRELNLQGPISYSLFKDIILDTAIIVEGVMHHTLQELISEGKIAEEKVMGKEEIYRDRKSLFNSKVEDFEVCAVKFKRAGKTLRSNSNFIEIIQAFKRGKLISNELYNRVETLRKKRNKIHLVSLGSSEDDFLNENDVEEAFLIAGEIMDKSKSVLG